jgi:uncharacterized protein (TIGR04222 family)
VNEPWGISGPAFISLYLALLVVPPLFLVVTVTVLRRRGAGAAAPLPGTTHAAYLAGGADRVTDTTIATLVEREHLRVNTGGRLTVIGERPPGGLEGALWGRVKNNPRRKIARLRSEFREHPAVTRLAAELTERGLLVPRAPLTRAWRVTLALYGLVFLIGGARWINGMRLDRPVGALTVLLVVTLILMVLVVRAQGWVERRPTATGSRSLKDARGTALLAGAAGAVALGGLSRYPDATIGAALAAGSSGGWSGGDGGSSSGSSCGGGSSCGSGGGCGG